MTPLFLLVAACVAAMIAAFLVGRNTAGVRSKTYYENALKRMMGQNAEHARQIDLRDRQIGDYIEQIDSLTTKKKELEAHIELIDKEREELDARLQQDRTGFRATVQAAATREAQHLVIRQHVAKIMEVLDVNQVDDGSGSERDSSLRAREESVRPVQHALSPSCGGRYTGVLDVSGDAAYLCEREEGDELRSTSSHECDAEN